MTILTYDKSFIRGPKMNKPTDVTRCDILTPYKRNIHDVFKKIKSEK